MNETRQNPMMLVALLNRGEGLPHETHECGMCGSWFPEKETRVLVTKDQGEWDDIRVCNTCEPIWIARGWWRE